MNVLADWNFRWQRWRRGALAVRRARVYGVGTPKSGTHSLAAMFSANVAAAHEAQSAELSRQFFNWREGRLDGRELAAWIHARDRELALEVDSSWLNILILEFLVAEFPQARFVLTIRDCYSWLNSEFRRVLRPTSQAPERIKLRKFLYHPDDAPFAPEEQLLKETGLYTVSGYLSRWAAHNHQVLATVPPDRLLIVRTADIRPRAAEIADFCGLPRYSLRLHRTHEYRNPVARQMIHELAPAFLEEKVAQHCRSLMSRFFPEIKSLGDAKC